MPPVHHHVWHLGAAAITTAVPLPVEPKPERHLPRGPREAHSTPGSSGCYMGQYKYYNSGTSFSVVTDHPPLQWLARMKDMPVLLVGTWCSSHNYFWCHTKTESSIIMGILLSQQVTPLRCLNCTIWCHGGGLPSPLSSFSPMPVNMVRMPATGCLFSLQLSELPIP